MIIYILDGFGWIFFFWLYIYIYNVYKVLIYNILTTKRKVSGKYLS